MVAVYEQRYGVAMVNEFASGVSVVDDVVQWTFACPSSCC